MSIQLKSTKYTLANYISESGEHIKVVAGPINRQTYSDTWFDSKTTRVYVNGRKVEEYEEDQFPMEFVPTLRRRLETLVENQADVEEVLTTINDVMSELTNYQEESIDNPEEFPSFFEYD